MKISPFACAALFICALISISAGAQEYPSKTVTIIVPFAAGGAVDTLARILGQKLSENLGKPVVIDGRPGDSGNIGARFVAKAPNDGHTLLMSALTTYSMNATLMQGQTGYDLDRDFAAVSIVGYLPDHVLLSGFRVTPVVGFVRTGFELLPQPQEVHDTFEVPLSFIFEPANRRPRRRRFPGAGEAEIEVYDIPYGERNIWGATAGMLMTLHRTLSA